MRRLGTPLVIAAVAGVALVAAVDAVDTGGDAAAPRVAAAEPRPEPDLPARARDVLRRAGVRGTIGYSDVSCARYQLELPSLGRRQFLTRGCTVFGRRGNLGIEDGNVRWFAFPDGGTTTLLDRNRLDAALGARRHLVRDVAWLGGTRFVALVAQPGRRGHVLALFDGNRLERVITYLGPTWAEVRSSRGGTYFAVLHATEGLLVFDGRGRVVGPPRALRSARAVAWSPDERWIAVATRWSVWIVRPERAVTPLVQLPLVAVDLDWR